jgi:hypothetical protein
MSITIQGLHDAIVAVIAVAGIAVVFAVALTVAGTFWDRSRNQARKAVRAVAIPAQHPTQTDDARELVLR